MAKYGCWTGNWRLPLVLAASVSVIIAFAILKWLEGVITVLGYMWDNTVVARTMKANGLPLRRKLKPKLGQKLRLKLRQRTKLKKKA